MGVGEVSAGSCVHMHGSVGGAVSGQLLGLLLGKPVDLLAVRNHDIWVSTRLPWTSDDVRASPTRAPPSPVRGVVSLVWLVIRKRRRDSEV